MSLKGALEYDGNGGTTSTMTGTVDLSAAARPRRGVRRREQVGALPPRIRQVKYPFAAMLEMAGGVDYVSAANNAGCEKCHTDPYLKHGNIYAQVGGDP